MSVEYPFSDAFRESMELELKKRVDALERELSDRASELIVNRRDRVTREIIESASVHRRKMTALSLHRLRALRAAENAGKKNIEQLRLKHLEQAVRNRLEIFRKTPEYRTFLEGLLSECRECGFEGEGIFCAETTELELLSPLPPGLKGEARAMDSWGGFILIGKGGALFDCTFRTRWEAFCRKRSVEAQSSS